MKRFETFLKSLESVLGMGSLKVDKGETCLIKLREEHVEILFELDQQLVPNTILISCGVTHLPIENRSDILEVLLMANQGLGPTLSCKPDEEMVYLHQRLHPEIEAAELRPLLHTFIKNVHTWRKRVQELRSEPSRYSRLPPPPEGIRLSKYRG